MNSIVRYDPFRDFVSLRNAMDQLFEQSFVRPASGQGIQQGGFASIDVVENEQGYQLRAQLPGIKPEDIELTVQNNALSLKGTIHPWMQEEKKANWIVRESGSGSFERTVAFAKPINADGIETTYENGILSVSIPVAEESRFHRIPIKSQPEQKTIGDKPAGS